MTAVIYALCEPGTRTVRYIGKANEVKSRLRQHIHEARGICGGKTHKDRWILSVLSENKRPEIVILAEVIQGEWKSEERRFILAARMLGMNLTNASDGGDGNDGYLHTPETKALLSKKGRGRKATPETRARMSAARSGPNHPFFGKKLPKEHCANISKSHAGVPLSEAHIRASALARAGTKQAGSSSRYPGVCWVTSKSKWRAAWPKGNFLGYFNSETAAHNAVFQEQLA